MGEQVTLVNSAEETAKDLYRVLLAGDLYADREGEGDRRFLATGDPEQFLDLARRFLGPLIDTVGAARA
jgi:glutamate racemase